MKGRLLRQKRFCGAPAFILLCRRSASRTKSGVLGLRSLRAIRNARLYAARTVLALGLACATLAGAAPTSFSFDAHGCPMPCCRAHGRADCPSCHHKRLSKSAARAALAHDPVCGASLVKLGLGTRHTFSTRNIRLDGGASAGAIYRPCPNDCAGLLTSPTHSKRGRDETIAAESIRPPPISSHTRALDARRADADTSELCPRCSPRAPPPARHAS